MYENEIAIGKYAPHFALPIVQGGKFELGQTLLQGPVVVNFIRGTWCEFCTKHLEKVLVWRDSLNPKMALKTTVVVVSSEPVEKTLSFLSSTPMPFLFLHDSRGLVAKNYKFQSEEDEYSRPAMVLIAPDRKIRLIDDGFKDQRKCFSCR